MRYINLRFTYLLTYLLTYHNHCNSRIILVAVPGMIGAFVVLPSVVSTVVTVVGVSDQSIDQSINLFVDMQK